MAEERILIVDDAPSVVDVCAEILPGEGYQVRGANGGQEALTWLQEERFDCVISQGYCSTEDTLLFMTPMDRKLRQKKMKGAKGNRVNGAIEVFRLLPRCGSGEQGHEAGSRCGVDVRLVYKVVGLKFMALLAP